MKKIYIITLLFLVSFLSYGQLNTEGSEFWVDYHTNLGVGELKLFIASPEGASVDISNSAAAYSNKFNIEAGALQLVILPPTAYLQANGVSSNTFHIVSDSKIAVYGVNYQQYTTDAYVALPKESWGTEYRVATKTTRQHQMSVIAGEDNTEVVVNDAAGNTIWGTTLMEGQVYYYETTANLTGALVSSNKPVALFAGTNCANLPGSAACDHLVEQLPPTQSFGQNFIVLPSGETDLGSGNADFVQIIANEDNTVVTTLNNGEFVLNAGDESYYQYTAAEQIVANKPILVVQYGRGTYNGNGSYGDPMMMVIPPQDQFLKGYIVGAPQGFQYHFLNIVASEYSYTGITLDGVAIPESEFSEVGESGYYGARIQVAEGNHTLISSIPFGVFSYGINNYNSYGYAGGMSLAPVASVDQVSISPSNQTVDVKVDGSVTATVLDSDGNPMEGILVNFYISGIGDLQGGAYTDASGKAVYTYTRNDGGVDHIYAKVLNISSTTVDINWYEAPRVPVVVTNGISNVDSIAATFNGIVTDVGHQDATQHGFCWSTNEDPGLECEYSNMGVPTEGASFNKAVTGLNPATQYYVKAYAINDLDTVFGEQKAFVTAMIDQEASPASNVSCNSFTANWIKNSSATGYSLDISESADFSTYLEDYENKLISSNDIVSEDISGLENGKTYYYRVQGINSEYSLNSEYSSTYSVIIIDETPPEVICKDTIVYLNALGTANIDASFVDNGSSDACGIETMTLDVNDFDCSNVGKNTVTITATDVNGNLASSTVEVTVVDTILPVANCKPVTVYLDEFGQGTIAEDSIDNGSADACGIMSFDTDVTSFNCSDVWETNPVVLTVTDVNKNVSTCNTEVTVLDTVSPVAVCKPVTVYLDEFGQGTIAEDSIDNGSADACGILSFDTDVTSFSCSDVLETNPVVLTVTDVNKNVSTCNTEVTVLDTVSPVAVCKPVTVYLDEFGQGTIAEDSIDNGSADACGILSFDTDVTSFSCSDVLETNPVVLTVTDVNKNVSTCNTEVTVLDTVSPVAVCKPVTVYLDEFGQGTIAEDSIDNGSADACGILSFDTDVTSFSCSDVSETNPVVLTVTDVNKNVSTCNTEVTVLDTVSPVAVCKPVTVYLDEFGQGTIAEDSIDNGSADVCGILSFDTDVTSFDCSDVWETNPVVLTVTDVNKNVSTCNTEVTVLDTVSPVVFCKDTILYLGEDGVVSLDSSDLDMGSTDVCGVASVELSQRVFKGIDAGENRIQNIVTDINGNYSICISTVTIKDTIPPEVWCKNAGVDLYSRGGETPIFPVYVLDTAFDAGGIIAYNLDTTEYFCDDIGKHIVELSVKDVGGNVSSCTAEITIVDNNPPTVLCRDFEVALNTDGNAAISIDSIDAGSYDACGIAEMEISQSEFTGDNLGENMVTLYVTDINGNTDSCTAMVTVTDPVVPIVVCNSINVSVSDSSGYKLNDEDFVNLATGSADNATLFDSLSIEVIPSEFSCSQIGDSVLVEVIVTDAAGNYNSCETQIYVSNGFVMEMADLEVVLEPGQCETEIDYPEVFTSEHCGSVTLVDGLGIDGVFPVGTTVETWEIVLGDVVDTVSFAVTVKDTNQMAPGFDSIGDVSANENEVIVVPVTGISDGSSCSEYELELTASSLNIGLIESITVSYESGSDSAELVVNTVANENGSAEVIVVLSDENGVTYADTFIVSVASANSTPVLVNAIPDTSMQEEEVLQLSLSTILGDVFNDADGDALTWSFMLESDTVLAWMSVSEATNAYLIDFEPAHADTGCYNIIVKVSDPSGASASDTFEVCVTQIPVAVNDLGTEIAIINMYPNPTRGNVTLDLGRMNNDAEVWITDITGRLIFNQQYQFTDRVDIDLSEHVSGNYLVRMNLDGVVETRKLILKK